MAYTGKLTPSNNAKAWALEQKSFSKKLHNFPADTNEASVDQMPKQIAYWATYLAIHSDLQNNTDPLVSRFTRFVDSVFLRQGFLHQEYGETVAHIVKSDEIPEPGGQIIYKMFEYPRVFAETIEEPAVHVRAVFNDYEHRNADKVIDIEVWNSMRARQVEYTSTAIKNFIEIFVKSIILAGNPAVLVSDSILLYVWGKDTKVGDDYSKAMKALIDDNGEFVKLCKRAAGYFQKYFKNIFYFDPTYDSVWDSEWNDKIDAVTKPAKEVAAADADIKTILQTRYTQKTGANKDNPIKGLNRLTCIFSMIGILTKVLTKMTNVKSAANVMTFNRNATAKETGEQFFARADREHLILIMNPDDLADCRLNSSVTGPTGTATRNFSVVESMVSAVYALEGMLPGEAYIMDDRIINIFPFFNQTLEHKNAQYLITQFFTHYKFKWAIFGNFCAMKVVATKWNPGAYFLSRYLQEFKNA